MTQTFTRQVALAAVMLIFLPGFSTMAVASPAQELARLLEKNHSLKANFTQNIYDEQGKLIDQSQGQLTLVKPDQFRWQINTPIKQLVISNGKQVWIYSPDLEQVIIKPIDKTMSSTPLAILSGATSALSQNFVITKQQRNYYLHAKEPGSNFKTVVLQFSSDTINTLILFDHLGQKTVLRFAQTKLNAVVKPAHFQFVPPKGVDIIK